jgi:surface antigen
MFRVLVFFIFLAKCGHEMAGDLERYEVRQAALEKAQSNQNCKKEYMDVVIEGKNAKAYHLYCKNSGGKWVKM